jgi:tetratricopeptide (TPR) repeat protein
MIAYTKGSISYCYQFEGKINPAHEVAQETLKLAEETGDAYNKSMAYSCYGISCYHKGLFDEAKTRLLEFTSSYEKLAPLTWMGFTYVYLGCIYIDLREYDDAVNCYKKIIPIFQDASLAPSLVKHFQSCLMKAKALRHDQDIELSDLFACYDNYKLTWGKGWTARNIGDVLLHINDDRLADAKVWFQKAIEADSSNGLTWELAMDHACYANWFKKKGDQTGAKEQLTKAIDIFRECGADAWVEKYEKELVLIS